MNLVRILDCSVRCYLLVWGMCINCCVYARWRAEKKEMGPIRECHFYDQCPTASHSSVHREYSLYIICYMGAIMNNSRGATISIFLWPINYIELWCDKIHDIPFIGIVFIK